MHIATQLLRVAIKYVVKICDSEIIFKKSGTEEKSCSLIMYSSKI
jgi:hypothetical protein